MARKTAPDTQNSLVSMTTALYRYWEILYLSFYRFRVYSEVIHHWRGVGWRYLLLMVVLFSIPYAIRTIIHADHFIQERIIDTLKAIPALEIQKGKLIFDQPMPYLGRDAHGEVVVVVDTTSQVTSVVTPLYPNLSFLITANSIHFRAPKASHENVPFRRFEPQSIVTFPSSESIVISGSALTHYIAPLRWWIAGTLYPMIVSMLTTLLMIIFGALALLGKLCGRLFLKIRLTYCQACRLLVVSATPATFLLFLGLTLEWRVPWLGVVVLVMVAVYFFMGGIFYKRISQQLVRTS